MIFAAPKCKAGFFPVDRLHLFPGLGLFALHDQSPCECRCCPSTLFRTVIFSSVCIIQHVVEGQETCGEVRDLPWHMFDATSVLQVIFLPCLVLLD